MSDFLIILFEKKVIEKTDKWKTFAHPLVLHWLKVIYTENHQYPLTIGKMERGWLGRLC